MNIPDILALDFDGVLCDGMREYFEASRRTYMRVWPDEPTPSEELFPAFSTLRPVIMTGWEMPVLLRALVQGYSQAAMLQNWEAVRDALVPADTPQGKALGTTLTHTLDEVRRAWITATAADWLAHHEARAVILRPDRYVFALAGDRAALEVLHRSAMKWGE